jgi:hypothetical protein
MNTRGRMKRKLSSIDNLLITCAGHAIEVADIYADGGEAEIVANLIQLVELVKNVQQVVRHIDQSI